MIMNQTNQTVTYSHTGPDGGGGSCKDKPPKGEIPAGRHVVDTDVKAGHKVCFFKHRTNEFIDDTPVILAEPYIVRLDENGTADVFYELHFLREVASQLLNAGPELFEAAAKIAAEKR